MELIISFIDLPKLKAKQLVDFNLAADVGFYVDLASGRLLQLRVFVLFKQ